MPTAAATQQLIYSNSIVIHSNSLHCLYAVCITNTYTNRINNNMILSSSLVLCLFRQVRDCSGSILLCSSPSLSLLYSRDLCSSSGPTSLFSVFLEPSSPSFGPSKLSSAVSLCVIHAQYFCLLLIVG